MPIVCYPAHVSGRLRSTLLIECLSRSVSHNYRARDFFPIGLHHDQAQGRDITPGGGVQDLSDSLSPVVLRPIRRQLEAAEATPFDRIPRGAENARVASRQHGDSHPPSDQAPADHELIADLKRGNGDALRTLMGRYDRLVRFAIYRGSRVECQRDPAWLDSVASEVWTGFVGTLGRNPDRVPRELKTYFIQIARHKCIDALRKGRRGHATLSKGAGELDDLATPQPSALEIMSMAEEVAQLRRCISQLSPEDQALCSQIPQIAARRWRDVGRAVGLAESTVRSRWPGVVQRLKICLERRDTN